MNASVSILNDNLLYLNAWFAKNEALREDLQIIGAYLVWHQDGKQEKVQINSFYLPTLLYNIKFQENIQNPDEMKAEDLFRIIQVHVIAEKLRFTN